MGEKPLKFLAAVAQIAPVFLNREATIDKACKIIAEAADGGARIIAFPEAWVPTFPYWPRALPHPNRSLSVDAYVALYREAVEIPSPATERLCAAARKGSITVVMGLNEKESRQGGTMYNTLLYIGPSGEILGRHRKLMPTFEERCVWGMGGADSLQVYSTDCGRLSGLVCGNNLMTLAKYALLSQGEQIHVAVWPSRTGMKDMVDVVSRNYAIEGQVFVLCACGYFTADHVPDEFPLKPHTEWAIGGGSGIIDPMGRYLAGPVYDREELIQAEIDLDRIIAAKSVHDTTGHYARPDILRLEIRGQ
ncbi:MAG TPA: carbon-nitrogen hydrolase family protein, partial [bacterium]|nr:carbon-nitrogen hydrolase family protein [bacterium]